MEGSNYTKLSQEERVRIEIFLEMEKKPTVFWPSVGKVGFYYYFCEIISVKSDISWGYIADMAQFESDHINTHVVPEVKLEASAELLRYFKEKLRPGWSPEQKSKRIVSIYPKRLEISLHKIFTSLTNRPLLLCRPQFFVATWK